MEGFKGVRDSRNTVEVIVVMQLGEEVEIGLRATARRRTLDFPKRLITSLTSQYSSRASSQTLRKIIHVDTLLLLALLLSFHDRRRRESVNYSSLPPPHGITREAINILALLQAAFGLCSIHYP